MDPLPIHPRRPPLRHFPDGRPVHGWPFRRDYVHSCPLQCDASCVCPVSLCFPPPPSYPPCPPRSPRRSTRAPCVLSALVTAPRSPTPYPILPSCSPPFPSPSLLAYLVPLPTPLLLARSILMSGAWVCNLHGGRLPCISSAVCGPTGALSLTPCCVDFVVLVIGCLSCRPPPPPCAKSNSVDRIGSLCLVKGVY